MCFFLSLSSVERRVHACTDPVAVCAPQGIAPVGAKLPIPSLDGAAAPQVVLRSPKTAAETKIKISCPRLLQIILLIRVDSLFRVLLYLLPVYSKHIAFV